MALRSIAVGFFLFAVAGCGVNRGVSTPQAVIYPDGPRILVAASDYTTGALAILPIFSSDAIEALPIHSDAVVRSGEGDADYVVNRGTGNIQVVSKRENRIISQFSVGKESNPQDIVRVGADAAYVTRFASSKVLKIRLSDGARLDEPLDLKSYGFGQYGGNPQMTWMRREGDRVFIQLQRLKTPVEPSEKAYLIAIDLKTETITRDLVLQRTNPVTDFKTGPDGFLYLGEAGKTGLLSELDGGIEKVDPETLVSKKLVIDEARLGGDIVDFEILDGDRGVAIVSPPNSNRTRLVTFRPYANEAAVLVFETEKYWLQQLAIDRLRGELYIADRMPSSPGIRVLDVATLKEKRKIRMRLPPYQMVVAR